MAGSFAGVFGFGVVDGLGGPLGRRTGSLDAVIWQDLREEGQPAFVDRKVPEEQVEDQVWPTLTPAGHEPVPNVDEQLHRSRV